MNAKIFLNTLNKLSSNFQKQLAYDHLNNISFNKVLISQKRLLALDNSNKALFQVEYKQKDYAILKLNKPPVNSLDLESLEKINSQFDSFENDPKLKGVILTSNVPNVFSAGVDILEMYKCDVKRLEKFWPNVQNFWLKLYGSKKIYIAAINGHALAFGCVIAMSCDYRIMSNADKYKIGLTAVLLGINAPFWFKDTMVNTIGFRETEKALQFGKIFTPKQALSLGLVDELVDSDKLLEKAEETMKQWCKIPSIARELTKNSMRNETIQKLLTKKQDDLKQFIKSTTDPLLQKNLEVYLNNLKKK